ncbi:MAG: EAL domain-containing protein [Gammaproteobacteria bacterium]|nr:EAL domain-containing protein [Gammaproteobacteria bacterium]
MNTVVIISATKAISIKLARLGLLITGVWLLLSPLAWAEPAESGRLVLQLRWTHQFQFAGYYAALHKGLYSQRGLDVEIRAGAPDRRPVDEVIAGRAEFGVGNSELLLHYLRGEPLVALAAVFQHSPSVLLARADSGIRTPQDLADKRIMMVGGSEDVDFLAMFQREGMDSRRLNILPSSYNIDDLIHGRTDAFNAYLTNEPFSLLERGIEASVIEPSRYGVDFYSDFLFTSQRQLNLHPDQVKAFREASLAGWKYAMDHPEEIIDLILREYRPEKSRPHLQFEAAAMQKLILPRLIPLGTLNPGRVREMAESLVEFGLASPIYSLDGLIYDPNPQINRDLFRRVLLGGGLFALIGGLITLSLWRFNRRLRGEMEQRRATELQLKRSERHYRAIIENLQDVYVRVDQDGLVSEVSPSMTDVFGFTPAEIIGRGFTHHFAPDFSFAQFIALIDGHGGQLRNHEIRGQNRAGSERYLSISCRKILHHQQFQGIEGTIRDISQRKQAEENLQKQRDLAESIISTAQAIILVLDPQGNIVHFNPYLERLSGYRLDDLKGQNWFQIFILPGDLPKIERLFQKALGDIDISGQVNAIRLKNGNTRLVEWFNRTLKNAAGEVIGVLAVGHDISERVKAEERLQLAASVFTHAQEAIYITDPQGHIVDVNQAFCQITGYRREEALGKHVRLLKSGRHDALFYEDMWRKLSQEGSWAGEVWDRRKNGDLFPQLLTISSVQDHRGNLSHYVALFTEISEQKAYQNQLERIAHYDSLTQLPNRVLLADRLQQAMYQVERRQMQLAVVFLDLDGFKSINDNHGHDIGDELLIRLAERMRNALREGDTIGRMGGDEFVAVLSDISEAQDSIPLLERLLHAAAEPVQINELLLQVSASIGVTFYPQDEDVDADQLLRQADQAMYQAKVSGKNRYHLFDTETDRNTRGLHESLEAIRQALEKDQFLLYYQPKVNMRSGELVGVEALVRWNHPQRGILSPMNFLPVIENHKLGLALGEWVINRALSQMEDWLRQGLELAVSVNVSGQQLQQSDFTDQLQHLLAAHPRVSRQNLELEVVESSALEDIHKVSKIIQRCREMGVSFALDDFGTGYSSLTYLKRLPASRIKIDQTFVRDMLDDPDDLAILEGVLGMTRAFGLEAIAEGVETREHGEMLLQLDCLIGQGYGIGHPMPANKLPDWIKNWRPFPEWTEQKPLRRCDMPLLQAAAEHRAWIRGVRDYLQGSRTEPPSLDPSQCQVGQWLDQDGQQRFGQLASFATLRQNHRQLHELADALCRQPLPQALDQLEPLLQRRDAFLAQLKELIRESQRQS